MDKPKVGRPTSYTPELCDEICAKIASGDSIRTISRDEDMPCAATVFNWLRTHEDFLEQYTRAKEEQADALTEEILDIADDATNDWMERRNEDDKTTGWYLNGEHVQRSRLRIESRKWLASKLKPKRYGDKQTVEHEGKIEVSLLGTVALPSGKAITDTE